MDEFDKVLNELEGATAIAFGIGFVGAYAIGVPEEVTIGIASASAIIYGCSKLTSAMKKG